MNFTAQSVPSQRMTWGTLQIAVEGLYLCLPSTRRNFGARFRIWDYHVQAEWGYGEVGDFRGIEQGQDKMFPPKVGSNTIGGGTISSINVPSS